MRLAPLATMAAAMVTLGGCAFHPIMPVRMADAGGAAACPMAGTVTPGAAAHGYGMHGMHGGQPGWHGMHAMHEHHGAAGTPAADCACPAAPAAEPPR